MSISLCLWPRWPPPPSCSCWSCIPNCTIILKWLRWLNMLVSLHILAFYCFFNQHSIYSSLLQHDLGYISATNHIGGTLWTSLSCVPHIVFFWDTPASYVDEVIPSRNYEIATATTPALFVFWKPKSCWTQNVTFVVYVFYLHGPILHSLVGLSSQVPTEWLHRIWFCWYSKTKTYSIYIYKYNHKIQTHMLYYMCKILKAGGLERSHRLPQDCTKVMHRKFGDIVWRKIKYVHGYDVTFKGDIALGRSHCLPRVCPTVQHPYPSLLHEIWLSWKNKKTYPQLVPCYIPTPYPW